MDSMMPGMMVLTVEELNEYVRKTLAGDPMLRSLCLRGEMSNFKRHVSGHWYFTLKDAASAISCAMFRQAASGVCFQPKDGQQLRLFGSVGLYTKTGQYQFYAQAMEPDGVGELYAQFEALKGRLAKEGLFDPALKKPLPFLPKGVGIVTSKTGAVVHDIARVAWRRNPGMPLYLCPVAVQGQDAAREIAAGIALLDQLEAVDVIIVGRGGGSMEDLWAFNEEAVALAIAVCEKPVVSAVGHETDVTIADFVADVRAPTPSAAAELVVQPRQALLQAVVQDKERMERACQYALSQGQSRLSQAEKRLGDHNPERMREGMLARVHRAADRLEARTNQLLAEKTHRLAQRAMQIRTSGPQATLARGYALVLSEGNLVQTVDGLHPGQEATVLLAGGQAAVTVIDVEKGDTLWQEKTTRPNH